MKRGSNGKLNLLLCSIMALISIPLISAKPFSEFIGDFLSGSDSVFSKLLGTPALIYLVVIVAIIFVSYHALMLIVQIFFPASISDSKSTKWILGGLCGALGISVFIVGRSSPEALGSVIQTFSIGAFGYLMFILTLFAMWFLGIALYNWMDDVHPDHMFVNALVYGPLTYMGGYLVFNSFMNFVSLLMSAGAGGRYSSFFSFGGASSSISQYPQVIQDNLLLSIFANENGIPLGITILVVGLVFWFFSHKNKISEGITNLAKDGAKEMSLWAGRFGKDAKDLHDDDVKNSLTKFRKKFDSYCDNLKKILDKIKGEITHLASCCVNVKLHATGALTPAEVRAINSGIADLETKYKTGHLSGDFEELVNSVDKIKSGDDNMLEEFIRTNKLWHDKHVLDKENTLKFVNRVSQFESGIPKQMEDIEKFAGELKADMDKVLTSLLTLKHTLGSVGNSTGVVVYRGSINTNLAGYKRVINSHAVNLTRAKKQLDYI